MEGGMPLSDAKNIIDLSVYTLPNFWSGRDGSQELTIESTMLRTADLCQIGGYEQWWQRLARDVRESVLRGGVETIPASIWLFNICRSEYALRLMSQTLETALQAIEIPEFNRGYPWNDLRPVKVDEKLSYKMDLILPVASIIVFANIILRPSLWDTPLVRKALDTILNEQTDAGSWHWWAEREAESVESTALAMHALALAKPTGWKHAVGQAYEWLWEVQNDEGFWSGGSGSDAVHLTVLVMDALELAAGGTATTFTVPESHSAVDDAPIPATTIINIQPKGDAIIGGDVVGGSKNEESGIETTESSD